ncbi:MAG TPA: hypothetical protein VLY20_03030 [Nitrospiria bacterium]|nr:hypothetical protein [Nitrospiria bacterium]HUK55612.1 hypothetical protein [Nitrospiria bacterium]
MLNRKKTAWVSIILIGGILLADDVLADELPIFYKGIRPLGMGGAFTAVADDENAMFYNPAGLNSIKGFGGVGILNPYVEASKNIKSFYNDVKDVSNAQSDTEQADLAATLLENWLGQHLHLRTGLFPNVTMHNFGIGFLGQATFDGEVHNPLGVNTLQLRGGYDLALVASGAYGFNLFNAPLQVGMTGKLINRRMLDKTYTTSDLVEQDGIDLSRDLQSGNGVGVDLGAIYAPPVFLEPAFGVSLQNIGNVNLGDAGKLEQQLNLGAALHPPVGFGKLLLALDVIDVTNQLGEDHDLAKRINAGVEYKLPMLVALRAGLHQGYPSYGFTVDLWVLKASYAYYIEEIGAYAGQRPDRRNIAQVSMGF